MVILANLATTFARFLRARRTTLLVGALVASAVASTQSLRLNISPSVSWGLYRLVSVPAEVPRGALVVLPVPASVQHVWSAWVPLLKPVAAVAGDVVCLDDGVLWIGGVSYGSIVHPAHDRPLPSIDHGCLIVPSGYVFLASRAPRSLDSRYYGPIAIHTLSAVALPLMTFGGTYGSGQ